MKLTKIISVWDLLHVKDTGELGFCDLEQAIEKIVGVENDVDSSIPDKPPATGTASESEIDRLAAYIMKVYPHEIGKGDPVHGESAVDVSIRLLDHNQNFLKAIKLEIGHLKELLGITWGQINDAVNGKNIEQSTGTRAITTKTEKPLEDCPDCMGNGYVSNIEGEHGLETVRCHTCGGSGIAKGDK